MTSVQFPGLERKELPRIMTVLEAALHCGFDLQHVCGGNARCATCEVKVVSGEVNDPVKREEDLLFDRVQAHNQRLGCVCKILGDVEIAVPVYTTSIDAIYDEMPGVVVSRGRFHNYRQHLKHEESRDVDSPFYIFRKRYSTTQALRNQREERHRLAQAKEFGRQGRGGAQEASRQADQQSDNRQGDPRKRNRRRRRPGGGQGQAQQQRQPQLSAGQQRPASPQSNSNPKGDQAS